MTASPADVEPTGGVTELAPAKLNLDLRVLGRREDGFHELDSLVVFTDALADTVQAWPAGRIALEIVGDAPLAAALVAEIDDNLVLRAAHALAEHLGVRDGARLVLNKRIWVAAGLGGGSADAAAALRALCRLWGRAPSSEMMVRIAADLGSDVPVCLASTPALMTGRGETVEPMAGLPALPVVLVNPGAPVPTGPVFRGLRAYASARADGLPAEGDLPGVLAALACSENSLEIPAMELVPAIREVLHELCELPGCRLARMSGSGGTCFGLFADAGEAGRAAARLRAYRPEWRVAHGMTGASHMRMPG
ncbi:4-(cytidine 5'-diphospho)-2-C-methyl-D-erythritol kinase [Marinivivus vitaminiproducens]|uniref:4-(cytidine 5'-diphospho)-2-C-methyl-D-erythritol kinase n=1 Tax=Marinivivus vitaminiproducens TaxID=3035935 RepID=UPI00279D1539|nr:4-(cytidine 5'-diphospho)-2-C-methyl-D-erythritol kinase [Geminicoccaceae bacterium SCSIO 64248]